MQTAHRKNRYLTRLILAVMLFAQGILAVHACVDPNAAAVLSFSSQQTSNAILPCHVASKMSVNECLMHCTQADQVNHDPHVTTVVPASEMTMLVVSPPLQYTLAPSVYTPLVLNTGPPLSIRFCSFLI